MNASEPLPHEKAVLTLLDAATRADTEIVAAYRDCDCPAVCLGRMTTLREVATYCATLAPYADDMIGDPDDPIAARVWLDRSLARMGLRPGEGAFPARHSHTPLPLTVVDAIRANPDDHRLLVGAARDFDVTPGDALCAALADAPGWEPYDDTGTGPCDCGDGPSED